MCDQRGCKTGVNLSDRIATADCSAVIFKVPTNGLIIGSDGKMRNYNLSGTDSLSKLCSGLA